MLIRNLAGIITGKGFKERDGRFPREEECGFIEGAVSLRIDAANGTIAEVGAGLTSSGGEGTFDGTGLVAMPGFVDPHTHALFAGDRSGEFFQRWGGASYQEINASGGGIRQTVAATMGSSNEELARLLTGRLLHFGRSGTTVVEVKSGYGDSAADEVRLLTLLNSLRKRDGLPEVVPTYLALHALPAGRDEEEYCTERIRALRLIADLGLAESVDSFPEHGFFTREEAGRFSEAAKALGLKVRVHADELSDLGTTGHFAAMGAVSVDHLQNASEEAVQVLARSSSTAVVLPATSFFLGLPYCDARRLIDAGARVALATDYNPGTAPVLDFQFVNLLAASMLKMTPAEILCAGTYNAAAALGREERHGAILPGYSADIQLYQAAPFAGIGNLLERMIITRTVPSKVMIRGSWLS